MNEKVQTKWREGYALGQDCIAFGDGRIVMANTYSVVDSDTNRATQYWFPLCDTTLESLEKYDEDMWTEVDIFHGFFEFENQTIVFGDGGMGNEGYVASIDADKKLNWSIFFTFSNPIIRAEMVDRQLICYGDTGAVIKINIDELTSISVKL